MNKVFFLAVSISLTFTALGQTSCYWIATSPGNWSDSLNWSTTQNGSIGGGIPRSGEIAIFHGSDKGACTIDVNINVNKLETRSGFDEEIVAEASTITVGAGGLKHNAGTFDCGSASVTVSGNLTITDDFISTSGLLIVGGDFLLDATQHFDPVEGTVLFNGITTNDITNSPQFYELILKGASVGTSILTASQGFSVYRDLIIEEESGDIKINGGTISIGGDFYPQTVWKTGTAGLNMNGLGNQQLYINGSIDVPEFSINKLSGNVISRGSLAIEDELTLNQGNILFGNLDSIILDTLCIVTNANDKSFVDGKIVKIGNAGFVFPCGSDSKYAPVTISNLSHIQHVSCRYYSSSTPDQGDISSPVNFIDPCSYWAMEGTSGKTLKITFSPFQYKSCLGLDAITNGELISNTAGTWNNETTTNTATDIVSATITPTGLYALGSSGTNTCVENALYWVGTTSTSWNNALNWSKTSGGPGGYGVPCKNSTVIFDGNGNIDCDLSTNVEVAMALFRPDYTAEITTNGFQLRIKELFK